MSTPELITRQYGRLSCLERPAANPGKQRPLTVVMAHGFGANAWDLAPLADTIDREAALRWLFPQAPSSLAGAAGQPGIPDTDYRPEIGRAWFPRSQEDLREALFGNYFATIGDQRPPDLGSAGDELLELVSEAQGSDAELTGVVLGGFSQGAMVAVEAVLRASSLPEGIILLSGNPIDRDRWKELFTTFPERHERKSVPYFQSHGTSDPVLSYQSARELNDMLTRAGFVGEFQHFPGGHTIPNEVVWSLSEFLFSL
jgi:phospholipase/carboxylesterase